MVHSEKDLVILYSPKTLPHSTYPVPSKLTVSPSQPTEIALLAYHGDETVTIYDDYPYTSRDDVDAALDALYYDRLTLIRGQKGQRDDPYLLYHLCSSAAGASGGPLVNSHGELIGTILNFHWRPFLTVKVSTSKESITMVSWNMVVKILVFD